MSTYLDKTFCASDGCKNKCGRQLTDKIRSNASQLRIPLCIGYFCDDNGEIKSKNNLENKQG